MKCVALMTALAGTALAAVPASPPAGTSPATLAAPVRLPHPSGDAFLFAARKCVGGCALVVVSHSNGMTSELSLTRPHLLAVYARLTEAGFAVLVSNDAGPTSWGAPAALTYLADVQARATQLFAFNGRTYNLGISMGGLPALLAAYQGVYPVAGVALLDAQVNLQDVWTGRNSKFSEEVTAAHGLNVGVPLPYGRDPLNHYDGTAARQLPIWVAGSDEDSVVSLARNGAALFARNAAPDSRLLRLKGPHLGGSHFGEVTVQDLVAFLQRVERRLSGGPAAVGR